jgi:hypothetical protein
MDTSAIASDLPIRQSLPSLRPVPAAVRGDGVAAPGGDDPLAGEHQAAGRRGRKGWTGLGMGPPPDRSAGPWTAAAATPASTAKTTAGDNPVTGPPRWVWSWADAAAFHEMSGGLVDDLPPPPAHVPRRLLADPVFVRALQDRDFSVVFAMAHGVGISFNRIAEACALKSDRVSQITRGAGSVTALATVERIAGGLRIPGAFLGLAAQPWEDTAAPSTESHHGDDPMKRRNLLRGAIAADLRPGARRPHRRPDRRRPAPLPRRSPGPRRPGGRSQKLRVRLPRPAAHPGPRRFGRRLRLPGPAARRGAARPGTGSCAARPDRWRA